MGIHLMSFETEQIVKTAQVLLVALAILALSGVASAQQFGPSVSTPGMVASAGPTNPPVPAPPLVVRGSVQTMHGAPLPSNPDGASGLRGDFQNATSLVASRYTNLVVLEVNQFDGHLESVAMTQCSPYTPPPTVGSPTTTVIIQGCADQISGAFMFYGTWDGRPLDRGRQHYLQVSAPGFISRTIKLPVGVSDVNLQTVNLESSPIESVTVSGQRIVGNQLSFTVEMIKIIPETLSLSVSAVVWLPVEPYLPFVVSLPVMTADKFRNTAEFNITLPDTILPGTIVSATIGVADGKQAFKPYAQGYVSAMK